MSRKTAPRPALSRAIERLLGASSGRPLLHGSQDAIAGVYSGAHFIARDPRRVPLPRSRVACDEEGATVTD